MNRIVFVALLLVLFVIKNKVNTDNVPVKSKSGKSFFVNPNESQKIQLEKSNLLEKLNRTVKHLIVLLKQSEYKNDPNVKKLFTNWSGFIEELDSTENNNVFAYNVNKGESISICLLNKKTNQMNSIHSYQT